MLLCNNHRCAPTVALPRSAAKSRASWPGCLGCSCGQDQQEPKHLAELEPCQAPLADSGLSLGLTLTQLLAPRRSCLVMGQTRSQTSSLHPTPYHSWEAAVDTYAFACFKELPRTLAGWDFAVSRTSSGRQNYFLPLLFPSGRLEKWKEMDASKPLGMVLGLPRAQHPSSLAEEHTHPPAQL